MFRRGIDVGVLGGPGHCPELGNGSPQRPPIEIVPQSGVAERRLAGNWQETEPMEVRASYPQVCNMVLEVHHLEWVYNI